MRKYTAYQTILYSRAMNLFPKQAHRAICVNLSENVSKKGDTFSVYSDETDYCRDSRNRVKGRKRYLLLNFFVRSKRLQFLSRLNARQGGFILMCSMLILVANKIVSL